MSEMRNGIQNRNITTRPNAAARLTPEEFYEPGLNQEIAAIHELGVEAFNDFIGRISQVEERKHEEGTQEEITELKPLMRGWQIGHKSSGNLRISGSLKERIAETLIYGQIKSPIDLEIGEIKKALSDFHKQVNHEKDWGEKQYQEKKKELRGK